MPFTVHNQLPVWWSTEPAALLDFPVWTTSDITHAVYVMLAELNTEKLLRLAIASRQQQQQVLSKPAVASIILLLDVEGVYVRLGTL